MNRLQVEYIPVADIKPYKHNAKIHTEEQVGQIMKSIGEFGFNDPIAVDEDNIIIEGHGRLIAAQKMKMAEVPVIVLRGLTDQQKKAYILAHNQLTMNTGFDLDILADELGRITAFDMTDFGFLDDMFGEQEKNPDDVVEDEPPVPPVEPKAKYGDIYQLGKHRLMCGDSTKAEDVEKLMNGEKADLVLTDPPYNVEYVGAKQRAAEWSGTNGVSVKKEIANDVLTEDGFYSFLEDVFRNMKAVINPTTPFYIWYADVSSIPLFTALKDNDLKVREMLIWVKNSLVLGWYDYQYMHEPCLYGYNEHAGHYFVDDRKQTTIIEDTNTDFSKLKKEELVKLLEDIYADKCPTTIIREDRPLKSDLHPTMKPIKLLARLINNSSRKNEIVLDLFGGSGSTMIACEQMDRQCRMMELDPKYVDVIIERWEKLTGEKAEKIA